MTFNPVAWLVWLLAAALPALLTRNPLYLTLALLAAWVTELAVGRRSPAAQSWNSFIRFSAVLWLLTIPFTVLTVHYGAVILFNLPPGWPIIGGPITLEAVLYAVSGGLALVTLLVAFATFNVAVDQARLLRLTPGFLYQAGVIAAIAIAFVPQMIASWQTIREAQEVRGHKVRGVRDLLPLIMPLLVTALERAVRLAESMEARGFGRELAPIAPARRLAQQLAILAGLGLLAVGLAGTGFWPGRQLAAAALLAGGVGLLAASFWDQGRRVQRSHYRRWYWSRVDRQICAIGSLAAAGWLVVWLFRGGWLLYYPYPPYSPWPTFEPLIGLLALAPAVAALILLPPARECAPAGPSTVPAAGGAVFAARLAASPAPSAAYRHFPDDGSRRAAYVRGREALLRPALPPESAQGPGVPGMDPAPAPQGPMPAPGLVAHLRKLAVAVLLALMWRR